MSATARAAKEEELKRLDREMKLAFRDSQQTLQRQKSQLSAKLVQEVREIVAAVGKEKGLAFVLERSSQGVLFVDDGVDITSEIIGRLDAASRCWIVSPDEQPSPFPPLAPVESSSSA